MNTAFDNWLQLLTAAGKGGTSLADNDIPQAVRGDPWKMSILCPGDFSTATMAGVIRAAPDSTVLATCSISAGTYDSGTGYTTWTASLASGSGANSTGSLPGDVDGDGYEAFPIAFTLTPSGGTAELFFGGAFILKGKV
jgi:hypothetical protein